MPERTRSPPGSSGCSSSTASSQTLICWLYRQPWPSSGPSRHRARRAGPRPPVVPGGSRGVLRHRRVHPGPRAHRVGAPGDGPDPHADRDGHGRGVFLRSGTDLVHALGDVVMAVPMVVVSPDTAPGMPRSHPDRGPRHLDVVLARVCAALQYTPSAPITRSAPTRRRHPTTFRGGHPRAPTRPTRRPPTRVPAGRVR
jgi:hypothetical protein